MRQAVEQYQVEGNAGGQTVAMGISAEAQNIVMDILSNMYANRQRAMVREYSTNAYDAHVEAGQTRPIEVTLPNALSPFLRIRDYGTGLTVDGIHTIYSQYGASTKRNSDTQNGTFGIGCKAALAYCSQFTVTSVKDGTKIVVTVGRDASGGGSMTIVDTLVTDEPNGTEVMIPVTRSDVDSIIEEARLFYRFWKPGTVLVNGKEPVYFEGLKLADDLFIMDGEDKSQIVMGNVAYPAPGLDDLLSSNGATVLAFVPIGAVNIPPPREALMDTKTTRATIQAIRTKFQGAVKGAIQREVNAAATPQDAIRVVVKWSRHVSGGANACDFAYQGATLPTVMRAGAYLPEKASYHQPEAAHMLVAGTNDYRVGNSRREVGIGVGSWPTTVWVEDFLPDKFTAQHKRKLLKWCEGESLTTSRTYGTHGVDQDVEQFVMLRGSLPTRAFIDPARIVSWDEVRKIKLEVKSRVSYGGVVRIPGSYDIWTETGFEVGIPGDDFRQQYPIFYYQGNRWEASPFDDALKVYHDHYTLVCLSKNRVVKFQRILPTAKEATEAITEKFSEWAKTVTEDERKALTMGDQTRSALILMDAGKIVDPALQDAVRIAKIDVAKIKEARKTFRRYVQTDALDIKWDNPLDNYPLFDYGSTYRPSGIQTFRRNAEHVYTYFNAAYAAR